METVYIVAIIAIAIAVLALVYILRDRITGLIVRIKGNSLEMKARPEQDAMPRPSGTGMVLDGTTVRRSKIRVVNSPFWARRSRVHRSNLDVSDSPGASDNHRG